MVQYREKENEELIKGAMLSYFTRIPESHLSFQQKSSSGANVWPAASFVSCIFCLVTTPVDTTPSLE